MWASRCACPAAWALRPQRHGSNRRCATPEAGPPPGEPLRFADILTTASAVANYLGAADVDAGHVLHAIAILQGRESLDDLGRPVSPLVRRVPPGARGDADPRLKELAQRWFATLGNDVNATLEGEELERLAEELRGLSPSAEG